ncbi:MAG: CsgG/HfaB family protein [Desulfomonilia bacterium]|nr:CsgG/HfaB family protein [Desulfomonilia bacterium]
MKTALLRNRFVTLVILLVCCCLLVGWGSEDPKRDDSSTTKKLESLPRAQGPRPVVTIYEFRSSVPEVSAAAATDMFTTALIKSGSFAVAERQRLNEGVLREKQMNAQGMTTGNSANQQLSGAQYIFEGTVSEANPEESKTGLGGTFKGLGLETSGQKANLGLDVRVVDANTGVVLDAVNVRKPVKQSGLSAKGVGSFAQKFTKKSLGGADASVAHESKEGIDQALRACIEQAVYELVKRYGG